MVVAALGDLQIGIILRRGQDTAILRLVCIDIVEALVAFAAQHLPDRVGNVKVGAGAKHAVDLRHFLQDLLLIALRKTAGDQDLLDPALRLELRHGENVVDGLGLCGLDKAAGVDDDELRTVGVGADLIPCLPQQPEHMLGIDLIFGAAKRDHAYRVGHGM